VHPGDPAYVEMLMDHWRAAGSVDQELHYLNLALERLSWYRGDYARARKLAEHGLTLVGKRDPRRANLLNHVCETYWRMGEFDDAARWGKRAYRAGKRFNLPYDVARALGNLGIVARLSGNSPRAKKLFVRSLVLRQQIDDEIGIARSYANLGIVAFDQGDMRAARRCYLRSLKIQRKLHDENGMILNLLNIGQVLTVQGKTAEGNRYIRAGLLKARKTGNRYATAACLNTLGIAAMIDDDEQTAAALLEESADIFRQLRNRFGMAHTVAYLLTFLPVDDPRFAPYVKVCAEISLALRSERFLLALAVGTARWYDAHGQTETARAQIASVRQHPHMDNEIAAALAHLFSAHPQLDGGAPHDKWDVFQAARDAAHAVTAR
jgi:tetratricopeptide (TPR) repeat protein